MPSPSNVQPARQPKPKTAKQRAKAEANAAAYRARCERLRHRQETLLKLTGTANMVAAAAMLPAIEREQETAKAMKAVNAHMSHPQYGQRLTKFIGQRPGVDPCRMLVVIRNWMATQGIVVDHVAPTT